MRNSTIFLIFLFVIILVFYFIGMDTIPGEPVLCVDGLNRVNLEGMMCESIESTWYGVPFGYSFLMFILFIPIEIILLNRMIGRL